MSALGRAAAPAFWVPRWADDAKRSDGGCPARNRAADEPNEAFSHRHQLAHQPRPLINRDASVDAFGYVRGDVSATDALLSFC